jgi:hypothetical protein
MCGCDKVPLTVKATDTRETVRARSAMCLLCPGGGRTGACAETGETVEHMVRHGGCPLGRHPDAAGIVRWQGMEWMGVPAVIRWAWPVLRRLHGLPALTGPLPGCGCHLAAKEAWLAFQRERPATARRIQAVGRWVLAVTKTARSVGYPSRLPGQSVTELSVTSAGKSVGPPLRITTSSPAAGIRHASQLRGSDHERPSPAPTQYRVRSGIGTSGGSASVGLPNLAANGAATIAPSTPKNERRVESMP